MALSVPGFSFGSQLTLAINSSTLPVNESFTVGTTTTTLSLPAGPFVRIEGTGVALNVAGQTLTGDFVLEQVTTGSGLTEIRVAASNVTLSLGGVVSLTNGQGVLVIVPNTPGVTPKDGGIAGQLSATVAVNVPDVTFQGALPGLDQPDGQGHRPASHASPARRSRSACRARPVPASRRGRASTLTIAGQTLSGDFAFSERVTKNSVTVTRLGVNNVALSLGDGANPFVSLTGGTGSFLVIPNSSPTAKDGGLAGQISGTTSCVNIPRA